MEFDAPIAKDSDRPPEEALPSTSYLDGIRFGKLEGFFDDKLAADAEVPSKKTQNKRKKTYKQILQKILGQFKKERSKIYFFDGYNIPELQVIFKLAVYQKEQILKKLKKLESFLDFGRDSVELKILDINLDKIQIKHFEDETNNLTGYTYLLEILGSKNLVSEGNFAVEKYGQSFAGGTQTSLGPDNPSPTKPNRPSITTTSPGLVSQNGISNPSGPSGKS